ncbi:MAG: glycosyltransferase [Gemmatimonadales bacterium]|nr:glycosyltransferase [Gemmatimonadales bacterium]
MIGSSLRDTLRLGLGLGTLITAVVGGVYLAWRILGQTDSLLYAGTFILSVFMLMGLVARYVAFMWLGYLHQVEQTAQVDAKGQVHWPPVTIIVPAYNEGPVIEQSVRSLLQLDYPAYEILVVDDGSSDDTAARVAPMEGRHGDVTVRLVSKRNGGKASALNTGIALARHDYVLCMDGDSKLEPQVLRVSMPHFAQAHVAAVAGNVKVINRQTHLARFQALEYIEGLNMARRAQGFVRVVNIIPGPIGLFRRQVLAEVGGYDRDTFAEDADLTLKILSAGYHIVYEDRAIAWTEAPEGVLDLIKQRYRWTRGILQAVRKRKFALLNPISLWVWLSLVLMLFEGIVMPAANVVVNGMFTMTALANQEYSVFIVYWFALFSLLDVIAAMYCCSAEQESLLLVPYAAAMRFFYFPLIDVTKLMATVDELQNVEMTWGKLQRQGRL